MMKKRDVVAGLGSVMIAILSTIYFLGEFSTLK